MSNKLQEYLDSTATNSDIYFELDDRDIFVEYEYNLGPYQGDGFFSEGVTPNIIHIGYYGTKLETILLKNIPKSPKDYIKMLSEIDETSTIRFNSEGEAILNFKINKKYIK